MSENRSTFDGPSSKDPLFSLGKIDLNEGRVHDLGRATKDVSSQRTAIKVFPAISGQRKADFLNETVAQLEISFEFGYMNRDQLDLIEKKAESINRMLWKLSKSHSDKGFSSAQRFHRF